jgi:hypothetical protein
MHGLGLVFSADEDLHRDGGYVHAQRVLHVNGDLFVRKFLQDAGPAAGAHDNGVGHGRLDHGAQDPARQHQGVCMRDERPDRDIDPLKPGCGTLEVPVVERQHHGFSRFRIEDA